MRTKKIVSLLVSLAFAAAPVRAAFQLPIASPESAAMANASMTSSRDSASLFVNPAQLAGTRHADFYFMHNQMYAGMAGVGSIGQSFLSAAAPSRLGTFAFGVGTFQAAGLMQERTIAVTYARRLGKRLEAGVTGKQLYHGFSSAGDPLAANDPVFNNGRGKSALTFDLGLSAKVSQPLRVGVVVRNANSPDVGLAVEDRVPREIQAGAAYDMGSRRGITLTADVAYRDDRSLSSQDRLTPGLGLEKRMAGEKFAFRLGVTPLEFTAGFGLNWGMIGLDYALVLRRTLMEGNVGTHMLGLRVRFGSGAYR
jgi:hypothetical protein